MSARTHSTSSLSLVVALVTALVGLVALTPRNRAGTPMAGSDGLALI
jgi:hypothetical protein